MSKILIIGSANTDMVIKSNKIPVPGETVLGGTFFLNPGGKGANQAVAAARLGGEVTFIAKVGNDQLGEESVVRWKQENIDTNYIFRDMENPSGVALIMVNAMGENCISVASGANNTLSPKDIEQSLKAFEGGNVLLMQLETPLETVVYAANYAHKNNYKVILNPAPATTLPMELYSKISVITPNESEAELLTNIKVTDENSAQIAAKTLCERGVKSCIITMGSKGSYLYENGNGVFIPAIKVKAVDTVAAGDVYNGALAVALAENMSLYDAVKFATKAASISVTRAGAQSSAPYRKEI